MVDDAFDILEKKSFDNRFFCCRRSLSCHGQKTSTEEHPPTRVTSISINIKFEIKKNLNKDREDICNSMHSKMILPLSWAPFGVHVSQADGRLSLMVVHSLGKGV